MFIFIVQQFSFQVRGLAQDLDLLQVAQNAGAR